MLSKYELNHIDNDKTLTEILSSQGLTKTKFLDNPPSIHTLTFFMGRFRTLRSFSYFKCLTKLEVIKHDLDKMDGLGGLVNLCELWLPQCKLKRISGLENLVQLKKLFLYGNEITVIECLDTLVNLEVLWVNDNRIKSLSGVKCLRSLKVLNIALNEISRLTNSQILELKSLVQLNISGNKIGQFKEIPVLNNLPRLVYVDFKSALFDENPVCNLCNYKTYVIYHLKRIKRLDEFEITPQIRKQSEVTFQKKRMYYNMRTKSFKRNMLSVVNKIDEVVVSKLKKMYYDEIKKMDKWKKIIDESCHNYYIINEKYNKIIKEIDYIVNVDYNIVFKRRIFDIYKYYERRYFVELNTGGNIRLEEGKLGDVWYQSCLDLINSRFFPKDFSPLGIKNIKINRVTRIHSRFLRSRFEENLEKIVEQNSNSNNNYNNSLEYLFYTSENKNELYDIIENGFPTAKYYHEEKMLDYAVPLSNSISICEYQRLYKIIASKTDKTSQSDLSSSLIISKVFLGNYGNEQTVIANSNSKGGGNSSKITPKKYPGFNAIYRIKSSSILDNSKQKKYFIFENKLILPEYIVEYEFIKEAKVSSSIIPTTLDKSIKPDNSYNDFLFLRKSFEDSKLSTIDYNDMKIFAHEFCQFYLKYENYLDRKFIYPESLLEKHKNFDDDSQKLNNIDYEVLKNRTNKEKLSDVTCLNLFNNNIAEIKSLSSMVNLKILILSFNSISKICGLSFLVNLEKLDLSYNKIKRLAGFTLMKNLKNLVINNNLIYRYDDVDILKFNLKKIEKLNLFNNPVCESSKNYRNFIIRKLSNLQILDNKLISENERRKAESQCSVLTYDLIIDICSKKSSSIESYVDGGGDRDDSVDFDLANVLELDFSNLNLRRIQNLDNLVGLKKLVLSDNEITKIENIEFCQHLNYLSLENNQIKKIENLSSNKHLERLLLGSNEISCLDYFYDEYTNFIKLTELSIERNRVKSLKGVKKLSNLLELYVSYNELENIKDILLLRNLKRLIILDLIGNKLCSTKHYRLYAIFHLKKLKVLDGVSIGTSEVVKSNNEFLGKVTHDLLVEKIGHSKFETVEELSLNQSSVRELSYLNQCNFSNLKNLYLEQNSVTSNLCGIEKLSSLVILKLSANKLNTSNNNQYFGKYIDKLIKLEILSLDSNNISSLNKFQLYKLINLRVLSMRNNQLTKISYLKDFGNNPLFNLNELLLDKNKIKYLDEKLFLLGLPNLLLLHLDENQIKTLDPFRKCFKLKQLYLSCNRVTDLAEFDNLIKLSDLKEIAFTFCPVGRKTLYRPSLIFKIPSLVFIDGKEVIEEERERAQIFFSNEFFSNDDVNTSSNSVGDDDYGDEYSRSSSSLRSPKSNILNQISNNSQLPVRLGNIYFQYHNTKNQLISNNISGLFSLNKRSEKGKRYKSYQSHFSQRRGPREIHYRGTRPRKLEKRSKKKTYKNRHISSSATIIK